MRENKAAAPGGGRPAGPDEQAAGDRALDRLALAIHGRNGIIKLENKNAAAPECCSTPEPAQVHNHLHNGSWAAPHASLYVIPKPFTRRE